MIPKLKFLQNWNNKLDCDYFTTIRLASKLDYYAKHVGECFDVQLKGSHYCDATLVKIHTLKLDELTLEQTWLDAGINKKEFYELMRRFYGKKTSWKGRNTELIYMTFRRHK